MRYLGFAVAFCFASICYSQTAFDKSEKLFNKYFLTDSTKALAELQYQRKNGRTHEEKLRYYLNEAVYANHNNRFGLAESYLDKTAKALRPGDVELEGEMLRIQSVIYFKQNRYKESSQILESFLNKNSNISPDLEAKLEMSICENDMATGDYNKAHQRALATYMVLRRKPSPLTRETKIRVLTSLYNICFYEAKYDSAIYYIYQAEPLLEKGSVKEAGFYDRIAIVYTTMEDYPKAIAYHEKSAAILEKSNAPILLAYTLYNLGSATKAVDIDKAAPILERALKTARAANYQQIIGYILQELGDLYVTKKDYARAEKYNLEALGIMRDAGIEHGVIHVLLNLGKQSYETGHYTEALKYLSEALVLAKDNDDVASLGYCYEYLYGTYEHMGNHKMALYYYKLFAQTERKILKLQQQGNIEKLHLSYDIRMEKATNRMLKKEVKLKNNTISAERKVKWLLGVLLFMLLVAGWFLRRLLVQRNRLKEFELQLTRSELKGVEKEKNLTVQELDTVKQQLIGKNALIGELNKLVLENEQHVISKERFGNLITNDSDWVQFLAKLQLLYPQFAENLKNKHPNLSNNEFRLAALIRLNLSDKEISELLIIELSSVKKAKHRLKQKLGLEANDKLDLYLGQL